MKIRFESNNTLPLGKVLSIPFIIIVTKSVFSEDNKCYPQVYLDKCVYECIKESQKYAILVQST